ncbi:MAG: thiamine pyrophosphate-binding protein [Gemmataceae bacterium]
MSESERPGSAADLLVRCLRSAGVRTVFGYPGGPLAPLYDALQRDGHIRHVLARHEQGAAFMAEGYARATGDPGVCLAVCGPGVYNAATPLANAYTDSVPLLLISGQVPTVGRGLRSGYYHENDQLDACTTMTKFRECVDSVQMLQPLFDRAWASLTDRRPGPALLEIPVNILASELSAMPGPSTPTMLVPPALKPKDGEVLAERIGKWQRPLIIAGGGVVAARAEPLLVQLAERLQAPVFHTLMGKGAIPGDHPLCAGLPWHQATSDITNMKPFISTLFAEADGLLSLGCRFSQVATAGWKVPVPAELVQIDVDKSELGRHYPVAMGVHADANQALRMLLAALPVEPRQPWAELPEKPPWRLTGIDLLGALRRVLPRDAIVVADVTRLAYIMLAQFPVYEPRTFLHPAGFISMGFGLPAALGAKAARPERSVVAVLGDGGFQMCALELATAVQEKLPVVVVLINDNALSLIRSIQERRFGSRFLGVDLENPDFGQLTRAFGAGHWRVDHDDAFEKALREALAAGQPGVVEVMVAK